MDTNPKSIGKRKQNDMKGFINSTPTTEAGEVATQKHYNINEELILEESKYDGLYAVCTNLEDDVMDIINRKRNRWEIEESFRIMKSEFKARPFYLSRDDRIKAHFTTCFLALVIYTYLEKKLDEKYTVTELLEMLKSYNIKKENEEGYSPLYIRMDMTDLLQDKFGFRTDYEFINLNCQYKSGKKFPYKQEKDAKIASLTSFFKL